MRGTDLLDKMELVDPAFVEEADQILKHKKLVRVRLSALAACLVLFIVIGLVLHGIPGVSSDTLDSPDLPVLTVSDLTLGMGFEGCTAHDISELVNDNPGMNLWNFPRSPVL